MVINFLTFKILLLIQVSDDDNENEKLLATEETDFEHEIFNINHRKSYI